MHADRRTKLHLRAQAIIFYALFAALVGALAWLSTRYTAELDWTAAKRNSISEQSLALLDRIEGPIAITAWSSASQPARRDQIRKIVGRYQARKADLTLAFIDPNTAPDKVRELGLTSDHTLVIEYAGRSEKVAPDFRGSYPESELTNALQRLVRGGERFVAFLEGHGERRFDGQANHDVAGLGQLLAARGLKLNYLNLTSAPKVPDNVAVLVIAAPQTELLPIEQTRLAEWLAGGGNLLWLADPWEGKKGLRGLAPLAAALGVEVLPGVIVDPNAQVLGLPDPRLIAVERYEPSPFTRDFDRITVFPVATGLALAEGGAWTARPFANSLPDAWLETGRYEGEITLDPKSDRAGPVTLGAWFTRELPAASPDAAPRQQRAVVMGDGDFLSNQFAGNAGNLDLGLNIVSWLAQDDDFIDINPKATPDATLALTDPQHIGLALGFLLVLPLGLIAIGITVWWRRRRA